jgi:hypothetical protein
VKALKKIYHSAIELAALAAVFYVLVPIVYGQIMLAQQVGNKPSSAADAPSEFDALTSGMHYYMDGFFKHAGLPNRGGPAHKLYDDPSDIVELELIYTHYPPGPNWLTGLAISIFGPKQVPLYRLFPIGFSVVGLLVTYALLRRVVGAILAAAAVVMVLQFPMIPGMMHGLFYHPYAVTLVIVQMSFLFNRLETKSRLSGKSLCLLAGMSFFQGWLSFDWAFVSMLFPLAVVSCWRDSTTRREMLRAVSVSVFGFALAHSLHFCQVWAIAPSFERAFEDLFGAAKFRMNGEGPKLVPENATIMILHKYIMTLFPSSSQAAFFSWLMPSIGIGLALVVGTMGRCIRGYSGKPKLITPALISMAMGFVISLIWFIVMKNHALEQGHWLFLPRHFILFLFSCVLVSAFELHAFACLIRSRSAGLSFLSSCKSRGTCEHNDEALHTS